MPRTSFLQHWCVAHPLPGQNPIPDHLSARSWALLTMHVRDGMSYSEIARTTGLHPQIVRDACEKARIRLLRHECGRRQQHNPAADLKPTW